MIPLFKPYVCKEAKENVMRVLDSSWLGMGPEVEAFEKEFAAYIGCKYAIAMNSCTEALRIALHVYSPYTKARVLTTPNTFVATNHVILQEGLIPYFIDIDPVTGSMNLDYIEAYMDIYPKSVEAIMWVHYGGNPIQLDRLRTIATRYGVHLIEDAAHATGAEWDGSKIGKDSEVACFSFHAVKNLATGDGGMLVTNDGIIASKATKLRWFGIDKSTADRTKDRAYGWEYDVKSLGYKAHMNDIAAAIGRGQLTKLDEQNAKREEVHKRYLENLYGTSVRPLIRDPKAKSSNHLMVVRFTDVAHKERAMANLTKAEIQYGYHYKPNYLYPPYLPFKTRKYPGMEEFYNTALSLPMHIFLRDIDVDKICEVITKEV